MTRLIFIFIFFFAPSLFANDQTANTIAAQSLLASGKWIKVCTDQTGIHRITFETLKNLGFTAPQNIRIFGFPPGPLSQYNQDSSGDDLTPLSIWQTKDNQQNDCFLFYVEGTVTWDYSQSTSSYIHRLNNFAQGHTYFFITEVTSVNDQLTILPQEKADASSVVTEFDALQYNEYENINLLETGSRWFSKLLTPSATLQQSFGLTDHVAGEPVKINLAVAARDNYSSTLTITANNSSIGTLTFSSYSNFDGADYAALREQSYSQIITGDNLDFTFKYQGTSSAKCWLDYIRLQSRRKLTIQGSALRFCDSRSVGVGKISEFQISNGSVGLKIWDITSPLSPMEISSTLNESTLSFKARTDSLRQFILFNPLADYPTIQSVEAITNQDLHGMATPGMLLITTPDFKSEADRLADYHRQRDDMEVSVILASQIYNEFSGGVADPTGIRNFVRSLYNKSLTNNTSTLKYLLLMGKGTYDNVHSVTSDNPCYLPTWQSESSLNLSTSFVSDDYFGLMGQNEGGQDGTIDIGIGRIPCTTIDEAKAVVDKVILHYHTSATLGTWQNNVCFIGDDQDNNIHVTDSENLANYVNLNYPSLSTHKIYLDAYTEETTPEQRYPEVNIAINNQVKEGALIINYVGHANNEGLAHEKILTIDEIDSWSNIDKLPVFVTASCEFSQWDLKDNQSAGEHVLFNKTGGGIALFSTSRLVYSSSNYMMNKSFFKYIFETDSEGEAPRLGDVIRKAKNDIGSSVNASKFVLLGDPALQLSLPKYNIKTLEINALPVEHLSDTLKPLSLVSVWGELQDYSGKKITAFNGQLLPSVYDKPTTHTTLGNGGQTPFTYTEQSSVIFKGNVSVTNGEFNFSFTVPKEINSRVGNGLIQYYAQNGSTDGNGSFSEFKIGGSSSFLTSDTIGPTIRLYLDNENFKSNDQVSKSPLMIAYLEDESGINTSESGIGHDLTVTIDNQTSDATVVNSYFTTDMDSYKSGKVIYQLPVLENGVHTLKFKGWDLANNSSEVTISFNVTASLQINHLVAFPNPASSYADFMACHNRYGEKMDVNLEIFTQQGILVDYIKTESSSSGFNTQPIRWTPGSNNVRVPSGIYYYRMRLTTTDGSTAVQSGSLIINH